MIEQVWISWLWLVQASEHTNTHNLSLVVVSILKEEL